ncbi:hypothetical protein L7F22_051156 [Adiantum nelumboides]|nr:hypothetical protein [Adiantum nelumboides]
MASDEGQSNPSTSGDTGGDHNEGFGNEYGPPLPTQEELREMEYRRLVGEATNLMLNFAKDSKLAKYMSETAFQDVQAQWKATTTSPPKPDSKQQYSEKELEEEIDARLARILGAQKQGKKHDRKRKKSTDFPGYLDSQSTFDKAKKHKKHADFAGHPDCRKSTSGYVFTFTGGTVSWISRLQKCVALSTTEAEYVAATEASKEVLWLMRLVEELGIKSQVPVLHCDSQSAIMLARNPVFHAKTKHIEVKYHFIRSVLDDKSTTLVKVHTDDNPADLLTKSLPAEREAQSSDSMPREQAEIFLNTAINFINVCSKDQIRLAPEKFTTLCKRVMENALQLNLPMRAVTPLHIAIIKLQPSPQYLTALHADFFLACLLAKCYNAALSILNEQIFEIDPKKCVLTAKDFLLYCYYGGMLYLGLKQFDKALECFHHVRYCLLYDHAFDFAEKEAEADCKEPLRLHPQHDKTLFHHGKALYQMQEYEEACMELGKAVDLNARDASIRAALAKSQVFLAHSTTGQYGEFLEKFVMSGSNLDAAPDCSDYLGPVEIQMTEDGRGRGLLARKRTSL